MIIAATVLLLCEIPRVCYIYLANYSAYLRRLLWPDLNYSYLIASLRNY